MTGDQFGSFFLADPEAFPETVKGQVWGDHQRVLDLPGGPFLITGLSAAQADLMDRDYSSFIAVASLSREDLHETAVFREDPGFFRVFDVNGWEYTLDLDPARDLLRVAAMHFAALVPWSNGAQAGLWTPVEETQFQGVIENYLRVLVAHRLLLQDGVLLHSAGVVIEGGAYLFMGASGAGKSTLARKAFDAGTPVLSDDLNGVVSLSTEPVVTQLPFTGELRDQATFDGAVPLRGIFLLNKGNGIACAPLSPGEAVAAIVTTAPFINRGSDNLDSLMAAANTLTASVQVARLTSATDSSFDEIKSAVHRFLE